MLIKMFCVTLVDSPLFENKKMTVHSDIQSLPCDLNLFAAAQGAQGSD